MLALSLTIIAYIVDMVSRQVQYQEKETDIIPPSSNLILLPLKRYRCHQTHKAVVLNVQRFRKPNLTQHLAHYISRCGPIINGPISCMKCTIMAALCGVIGKSSLYVVFKPPRRIHCQLSGDGARIPQAIL